MTDEDLARLLDDGKEPGALRTIGEVAGALGIRQHVLRYWEEQFPALRPVKRSGGRRYYRPDDIRLVATIDRLVHREGYTLKGARQALAAGAKADAPAPQPDAPAPQPGAITNQLRALRDGLAPGADAEVIARLRAIRNRLASALAAA
ncbi:MAG TPA: MerR family transcriptional regulator [Novosphingobium sp.]|nr:MerR family transcriptional regulator [Novosphingobium sp.]HMP57131.1 MerR family transcriptional regulator [Novosphingobium sp.]